MSLIFKVDTKGSCLLCLSSMCSGSSMTDLESTTAFKMLLRYLKVDWVKLVTSSSSNSVSGVDILGKWNCTTSVLVSLCAECSSVTTDFLELFQAFENIRLQLDLCVRQLHEFMARGNNDTDCRLDYERRMSTGNLEDVMSARITQKLRKEIMEKALDKMSYSLPRVRLLSSNRTTPTSPTIGKANFPQAGECVPEQPQCQLQGEIHITSFLENAKIPVSIPLQEFHTMDHAKPSQATNATLQCKYCNFSFASTRWKYLQAHQYHRHAKAFLTDKGLLPPSISEQQLEASLKNISGTGEPKDPVQCPFCKLWFKRKFPLRGHLLQNHLSHVIKEAEKFVKDPEGCVRQVDKFENNCRRPKPRNDWHKCVPCGETFLNELALKRHKLQMHLTKGLKRLLPPSLSEQGVIGVLKRITGKSQIIPRKGMEMYKCYECFWCKEQVWKLKFHLLKCHLDQIVKQVKKGGQPQTTFAAKYKCKYCRKQLRTLAGLKYHCSLKHNMTITTAKKPNQQLKCDSCLLTFMHEASLKVHAILYHPAVTYSSLLPPGVSDDDFNKALTWIISKGKTTDGGVICVGSSRFECPLCKHRMKQKIELRLHIVRCHLDKVIETIKLKEYYVPLKCQ